MSNRLVQPGRRAATPIVIVGHVDHGKSTLIGRLLHDTGNLPDGRIEAAIASSQARGLQIEWSFVLDSLQAERDQGVTIDSTRLPFALNGRPFVIVDAPGHRQFLRNMVTGAAGAAAAVLVVDVAEGARDQTRRHAMLLRLIGVQHVIVLMNKADLLDYDPERIAGATREVAEVLAKLGLEPAAFIPASARDGDNIATRSEHTPWYSGPTLAGALESVPALAPQTERPLRMPVQDVYRDHDRRLVVGRIEAGRVKAGDEIVVAPHNTRARVAAIEAWNASPAFSAAAGQSTALVLEPDAVVVRGDIIHAPAQPPLRAPRVRARLFWLRQEPLVAGESFRLRLNTAEYGVTVGAIESVVQIDDLTDRPADQVPPEGFADVVLVADMPVLFDPFEPGGAGGRGVLVDAAGQIVGGAPLLGPAANGAAVSDVTAVTPAERARTKGHATGIFALVAVPGTDATAVARMAEALLFRRGVDVVLLAPEALSKAGVSSDERRGMLAAFLADAGHVVLLQSPVPGDNVPGRTIHQIQADSAEMIAGHVEAIVTTSSGEQRSTS